MKRILLFGILLFFASGVYAQTESQKMQAAIVGFFNGLSLFDPDSIRYYSTADFHLLEDGEVWNTDTLINRIMPRKNAGIKRVNKFAFIRIYQKGNMAWISYENTAEFSRADKKQTVRWMESAVLIKQKGVWKIQMLHSTPLK